MSLSRPGSLDTARGRVADHLQAQGFASLDAGTLGIDARGPQVGSLRRLWDDLPLDPYLPNGGRYRRRRYGCLRAARDGGTFTLQALRHATFRQDSIPVWAGTERRFAAISGTDLRHPLLRELILHDLEIIQRVRSADRWTVGVHLIRVTATVTEQGLATPEGRHRDGHDFIGMHLMGRSDCDGGASIIYQEAGSAPVRLVLAEPLASLIVNDRLVDHQVTPIVPTLAPRARRDMLLLDFCVDQAGAADA